MIGHRVNDQLITEQFIALRDNPGALLAFKDSTKQVQLIEEIRKQRDTIEAQKNLFADLTNFMAEMHREQNAQKIADRFLNTLVVKTEIEGGLLLVEGIRRGTIWFRCQKNIPEQFMEQITSAYLTLSLRGTGAILIPDEKFPQPGGSWMQFPILSNDYVQIGILIIKGLLMPEKHQIVRLYFEPLSAYLKNRFLSMQLEERANKDGLTGLYNRQYFENALAEEIKKAEKYDIHFGIIMADANGLKEVNDTYGHEAGDNLIKSIAHFLKNNSRETDIVARLGGDEFCMLLPNTNEKGARELLNRMKRLCDREEAKITDQTTVPISISFGAAGSDTTQPEEVVKKADLAMYEAKQRYYQEKGQKE